MIAYPFGKLSRRQFLQAAAGSAIFLLVSCRSREIVPATAVLPTSTPDMLPQQPPSQQRPRQVEITAVPDFYLQHYQDVAHVAPEAWRLTIDGLVERPLTLSYDEMLALPPVELMRTLECIGNPVGGNQIGNAVWRGFALAGLLEEAGVKESAVRARFEAADGYETSVRLEWLRQPGVLMAYEMNGAPLTAEHGFPLRIFMSGLYGQKMPKWITRIEFIDDDNHRGFWEDKGWSDVAAVKTNSQIMAPAHISQVPLPEVEIFGVAYAGDRAIQRVEIGVEERDDLIWFDAELLPGPSPEVWTQFYANWQPTAANSYVLLVRATDEAGFTQTERARGILEGAFPDGTDKIHSIVVKVG